MIVLAVFQASDPPIALSALARISFKEGASASALAAGVALFSGAPASASLPFTIAMFVGDAVWFSAPFGANNSTITAAMIRASARLSVLFMAISSLGRPKPTSPSVVKGPVRLHRALGHLSFSGQLSCSSGGFAITGQFFEEHIGITIFCTISHTFVILRRTQKSHFEWTKLKDEDSPLPSFVDDAE